MPKAPRRGNYSSISVEEIQLPDHRLGPAGELERKQMLDLLHHAIAQSGARCRDIMRWKLEGKIFVEIQKLMGVSSINTISTWEPKR